MTAPAWTPELHDAWSRACARKHQLAWTVINWDDLAAALAEIERLRHKNRYLAKFGSRIAELEAENERLGDTATEQKQEIERLRGEINRMHGELIQEMDKRWDVLP